jgi:hypothetical protein
MLSRKATSTNFIVFGLTQSGLEPTIYSTSCEHDNHYTTDAVPYKIWSKSVNQKQCYRWQKFVMNKYMCTYKYLHQFRLTKTRILNRRTKRCLARTVIDLVIVYVNVFQSYKCLFLLCNLTYNIPNILTTKKTS